MGLAILILGLAIFIGAHVFVSLRDHREQLIARIGEGPYKGAFSLVSILGLVLIVYGFALYRRTGLIPVWYPPGFLRHVSEALMHPFLVGVKLWAFAHLLSNGDLGGIVLFGGILGWAVYDRISLKRRADPGGPKIPIGGWKNDAVAVVVGTLIYLAVGFVFHPLAGVPVFGR